MALRAARALLAVAALLAAAPAAAVICQSYTTPAQCAGRVTDAGRCGWVDGACVAVAPLETGMAAVTSVEEPRFAITSVEEPAAVAAPAPAPERSPARRGLRQVPPSVCVDAPTPEGFTCEQQRSWGKCEEAWLVEGGFCRRTCGLCDRAPSARQPTPSTEGGMSAPAASENAAAGAAGAAAPEAEGPTSGAFCSQPPEKGPCRAALTSWYWDGASCKPFLYGGCQGNANRFADFDSCETAAALWCMEAAAAPAPAGAREERLAMQLASADLQAGAAATGGPVAAAPVAATDAGDQANTAAPASGGALGGPGLAPACLAAAGALLLVLL